MGGKFVLFTLVTGLRMKCKEGCVGHEKFFVKLRLNWLQLDKLFVRVVKEIGGGIIDLETVARLEV